MSFRKELILLITGYFLAAALYYLMDIYACYECSVGRGTYFYFVIGYTFIILLLVKIMKIASKIILFSAYPLALWCAMAFIANLMWAVIPFTRYQ